MKPPSNDQDARLGAGAVLGPLDGRHWVVCAIALVTVGLLVIGLVADDAMGPIFLSSLSGAGIVAFWLHHRERDSVASPKLT